LIASIVASPWISPVLASSVINPAFLSLIKPFYLSYFAAGNIRLGFTPLTVFRDGAVEKQVQHALHIPPLMKIAFACSLGYPARPADPYLRVRRELEDFAHKITSPTISLRPQDHFAHKHVLWSATNPACFQDQTP
jgi:hypothetical protein